MKVLVAYASRYGATKGIAEFIGARLAQRGIQAEVRDVRDLDGPGEIDASVIGSALYMFRWMKDAKRFVSRNREALASHPVWLFSSGPVGTKTTDARGRDLLEASGPRELGELREMLTPRDHRVFFGAFDGSRLRGTDGLFYRMARRSKDARESMPEGDYRNWKAIEAWADGIAQALAG
ncbi:MAG: flavodoxin domain-containing protein [Nitrososphaerales archaeon]|jgi:menaquinone-dependent protoporphyrinogen oxidase